MASRLHLAGILQYSEPLLKEIEEHLLKVYGILFSETLEKTAQKAQERLDELKAKTARMKQLSRDLRGDLRVMERRDKLRQLLREMMPLMLNGALAQYEIRPDRLEYHLLHNNRRGIDKYLDRIDRMVQELETQASAVLGEDAKKMREDVKKWREHFTDEEAKKMLEDAREGALPDLDIQLKPEHFPFLGEKFQRHVRKARGEDAGMFDDLPSVKVKLRNLGDPSMQGAWDHSSGELLVQLPQVQRIGAVKERLRDVLTHELRHMTQTVMSRALGIDQVRMDEGGRLIPQYRASPGMPPRDVQNLDIVQALTAAQPTAAQLSHLPPKERQRLRQRGRELEARRREIMQLHRLQSKRSVYNLDDLEFYTHLADRVLQFERVLEQFKDFSPEQKKLLFDIYSGAITVPKSVKTMMASGVASREAREWLRENDPNMAVLSQARPEPETFFRHLRKYRRDKWKKAVKEFAKAVAPKMPRAPAEKGSIQKLWEEFLEEKYDGGKAKVVNPNPKTRERYPEITVTYLMGQSDPAYQSSRTKVRREFAAWRQQRQQGSQPPPRPQPRREEAQELDLFARPPGR